MKLNKLIIKVDGSSVREVIFKSGLNLILNKRGVGRSGNSVGKSTLARVVDYIFMGSINPIYIDEEFKKPNKIIESLFQEHCVEASLELVGLDGIHHIFTRNLSISSEKRYFQVDGRSVKESAYEESIQNICFDIQTKRPSVRFVVPKFLRNDTHKMLNTTKFLDQHVSDKDYSELFLYLFGFKNTALLTEKRSASNLVSRMQKRSQSLNAIVKEQKPSNEIKKLKSETELLEQRFLRFDYSSKFENPIATLNDLQAQENILTQSTLNVDRQISNINRTVELP